MELEKLAEALKRRDEYAAKCPIQKRFQEVCPRCKATASDTCGVIASADGAFVEEARAALHQDSEEK